MLFGQVLEARPAFNALAMTGWHIAQVVDFLYASSGWKHGDNSELAKLTSKDDVFGDAARELHKYKFVEAGVDELRALVAKQHNWIGFMAISPPSGMCPPCTSICLGSPSP